MREGEAREREREGGRGTKKLLIRREQRNCRNCFNIDIFYIILASWFPSSLFIFCIYSFHSSFYGVWWLEYFDIFIINGDFHKKYESFVHDSLTNIITEETFLQDFLVIPQNCYKVAKGLTLKQLRDKSWKVYYFSYYFCYVCSNF